MRPGVWSSDCRAAAARSRAKRSALIAEAGGLSFAAVMASSPAPNRRMSARIGGSARSIRSVTTFWLDTDEHLLGFAVRDARDESADRLGSDDEVARDAALGVDDHGRRRPVRAVRGRNGAVVVMEHPGQAVLRRAGAVVLDVAARDERDEELVIALALPRAHLRKQRGAGPAGRVAEEDENREPGGAKIAQREQLAPEVG